MRDPKVQTSPSQDMSDTETESTTSDCFEDAEESVEVQAAPPPYTLNAFPAPSVIATLPSPDIEDQIHILTGDGVSGRDQRWRRLENLRRKGEEEDAGGGGTLEGSLPESTESSVEGIYAAGVRSLHPFKVVESDARSVQSESRSGASVARSSCRMSVDEVKVDEMAKVEDISESEEILKVEEDATDEVKTLVEVVKVKPMEEVDESRLFQEELLQKSHNPEMTSLMKESMFPEQDAVFQLASGSTSVYTAEVNNTRMMPPPAGPVAPPRRKRTTGSSSTSSLSRNQSVDEPPSPSNSGTTQLTPSTTVSTNLSFAPLVNNSTNIATTTALPNRSKGKEEERRRPKPLPAMSDIQSVAGLNMSGATRGEFVVRPQDDEKDRGSGEEERSFSCDPGGSPGAGAPLYGLKLSSSNFKEMRWRRHSHSYSEGELSKSAAVGRASSRGHEGHSTGGSGGYHSAGSRGTSQGGRGSGESRKSGHSGESDAGVVRQANVFIRTKSDSGKRLTDQEILRQIKQDKQPQDHNLQVKNLDTGAEMDLHTAEEQLPQSINPLSLHIMRLTEEYTGIGTRYPDTGGTDSDNDSMASSMEFELGLGKKKATFGKLLGNVTRSAKNAAKGLGLPTELARRQRSREEKEEEKLGRLATDIAATDGVQVSSDGAAAGYGFKRIQAHKSGPHDFENVQFGQDLSGYHEGAIWCMKFSLNGWLLATAGQDRFLRIWVLRDKFTFFHDMRRKYQQEHEVVTEEQLLQDAAREEYFASPDSVGHIFMDRPFVTYTGHTSDLLDISWSKNYFILTSSMDKTVRLWHISRKDCLCVFQHIDCVTALAFNPKNDQFFISGSLDGKIRLWNIPDKKVALWNEVPGSTKLITAANYCQNGKFAVVGTYDGRCIFYSTDQLKYHTTIHVRSARGKNSRGRKITGIEPMPGEDKILITSNDSRIRLYDLRDLSLVCKYKGYTNFSSQIRASFSPDGRYICSGSENQCVFLWSSLHVPQALTARKDRNNYYEAIRAHSAVVTCSLFAPEPKIVCKAVERGREAAGKGMSTSTEGYVVVSGDFDGDIKIFVNQTGI